MPALWLALFACRLEPADICGTYTACVSTVDATRATATQLAYGPESACWESEEEHDACAAACEGGLSELHETFPVTEACDDGTGPQAAAVFSARDRWHYAVDALGGDCADATIEDVEVTFYAGEGPAFTARVDLDGALDGGQFETGCTLTWDRWSCEVADDLLSSAPATWRLSGSFAPALLSGDLYVAGDQPAEGGDCTVEAEASGAPR
ncbi:MAG: hypothetical protein H6739_39060 [Alphaproteobacteria bacterium]|nr:hypothetical protein [Alphaproteobacteria bacterium]